MVYFRFRLNDLESNKCRQAVVTIEILLREDNWAIPENIHTHPRTASMF